MAIAGKVAITPKGDWNANTTYEKLDLVFYENASYVATKPSTGVLPTDESYWMLIVQSAGGADLDGIIDGTIQVGNAKTLDGHEADVFAKAVNLLNYMPLSGHSTKNGNLTLSSDDTVARYLTLKNAVRSLTFGLESNGNGYIYDDTNGKLVAGINLDGTFTWNGTASGNIKLTDKPTGGYTGTGEEREIDVGGIGSALWLQGNGITGIVTNGGFFGLNVNTNQFYGAMYNNVRLIDGKLKLSSGTDLNKNGVGFDYHLL